jgi:SPP1 gp7 family putative phage head morphogenesis protein
MQEVQRLLSEGEGPAAIRDAVEAAYAQGVSQSAQSLGRLVDDITSASLERVGQQIVFQRASLAGTRAFEQMQGFAGEAVTDLRRVLFDAVATGENPRETAKIIRERFDVSRSRAERIARTEVTTALRRGAWDETRAAEDELGTEVRLLHVSALIAGRTRRSHAARHGKLVTVQEQAEWYAQDGNSINCLCTARPVPVDAEGKPLFGEKLVQRMRDAREKFVKNAPEPGTV